MPPTQGKSTHAIPLSQFPPVSLERPLKLFGKTFEVHISTPLTLSPHTVLQSALGVSVLQIMRMQKDRPDRAWNALLRAIRGTNRPSGTTRKLVKQTLGAGLPSDTLDALLQGNEPTTPPPWETDWEAALQGLGEPGEDNWYQSVARLANLDRLALSIRKLAEQGLRTDAEALLAQQIGRPDEHWKKCYPNLTLKVALLVEISLQTLAWLEWRGVSKSHVDAAAPPASQLLSLLAPKKKPIGHWLLRMQKSAICTNLRQFSKFMRGKGIKWHSRYLSYDILKKWSSGKQLIPGKAGNTVLKAVGGRVNIEREWRFFAAARFLSFLCDLVIAGTRGNPPSWVKAQEQLSERYSELYKLASIRTVA